MSDVLLLHHVQGLTPGMTALADRLRGEGHTVHSPDLFDGRTFETLEEGIAHAKSIGFGTLQERGIAAAEALQPDLVYIGVSMGVMAAQQLAQTRSGARGAILIDSCIPTDEFGGPWPDGVPVQIHGMDADPIFAEEGDLDAARALAEETDEAELFVYPGDRHLWSDSSLASHDADATELMITRVLDFLGGRA